MSKDDAELWRKRLYRVADNYGMVGVGHKTLIEAADRIEALNAEIARLKADAERLDWLADHPREATIRVGADMKACVFYGVSCDPKWTAREAIDAAIAAK